MCKLLWSDWPMFILEIPLKVNHTADWVVLWHVYRHAIDKLGHNSGWYKLWFEYDGLLLSRNNFSLTIFQKYHSFENGQVNWECVVAEPTVMQLTFKNKL